MKCKFRQNHLLLWLYGLLINLINEIHISNSTSWEERQSIHLVLKKTQTPTPP